jgi:hypothetical protein
MMAAMNKLSPCPHCASFLPLGVGACPGCQRSVRRSRRLPAPMRALLAVGGGGLLSVTLSACYGGPCAGPGGSCYEPYDSGPARCTDFSQDLDGDGYCLDQDCDETNANVHSGASCPAGDAGLTDGGSTSDAGSMDDAGTDGGLSTDDGGLTTDGGSTTDAGADASL